MALKYRTCRRCHTPKLLTEFTIDSTYRYGSREICKDCEANPRAQANTKWRANAQAKIRTCPDHKLEYRDRYCPECRKAERREYLAGRQDEIRVQRAERYRRDKELPGWLDNHYEKSRQTYERIRMQVHEAYGGKCYCCGLDDWRFLTVDHVHNDGHKDRHPNGRRVTGHKIYKEALAAVGTGRFRLACFNCNCARQHRGEGGVCPHELDRRKLAEVA